MSTVDLGWTALALVAGLLGVPALAAIGYALVVGVRALRLAGEAAGGRRKALYLIGFNLCEPFVNGIVIGLVLLTIGFREPREIALAVTAAMAILLLPAPLMRSPDELAARTADQLVAMALSRWIWTLLTLLTFPLGLLLIPIGALILALCARWSAKRIPLLLEAAPEPRAPGQIIVRRDS